MQNNRALVPDEPGPEEWGPGYELWQSTRSLLGQRGPEGTTSLVRMASHLVVLFVAVAVIWVSRIQLPRIDLADIGVQEVASEAFVDEVVEVEPAPEEAPAESELVAEAAPADAIALQRAAVPITLIPERARLDVITHTVVPGDTLYGIAQEYKLKAETLVWANKALETNPDLLRLGQQVTILPVDGVYHTVAKNDTLEKIAKAYKSAPGAILDYPWNRLDPNNPSLQVGQQVIVPGGRKPEVVRRVEIYKGKVPAGASKGSGRFVWPTAGYVSQGFRPLHRAVDIARSRGTPVKAADSGYVVLAGWTNTGYGNHIVIDHGNGYQTLYGHLDRIFVRAGEVVPQGTVIGNMGSTGRSTGPHLHFEIRYRGIQKNPFSFLP